MAIIAPAPYTEMPAETQFSVLLWMAVEERGEKGSESALIGCSSSWVSDLSATPLDI